MVILRSATTKKWGRCFYCQAAYSALQSAVPVYFLTATIGFLLSNMDLSMQIR